MTPAQEKGIVPGKLYYVYDENLSKHKECAVNGTVVELIDDDGSWLPWFKYIRGPQGIHTHLHAERLCLNIAGIKLLEEPLDNLTEVRDNTFLLNEYIRINYPKDEFLRILIDNLKGN